MNILKITRTGTIKKVLVLFFLIPFQSKSQDTLSFWEPAPHYLPKRGLILGTGLGITYAASMTGLYTLWYKDYPLEKFHFFNDNGEWLQIDKAGHFGSSYYMGKWGIEICRWTGMRDKKAIWMGGSMGLAFLTTIEIFDGFSDQWGFSSGDMIANTSGAALVIGQELAWKEQRIRVKFSYHETGYPKYRPDQLGGDFSERLFKDYNGQTYWLSANIRSFTGVGPAWLNLAAGYGAEGMTGARANVTEIKGMPVPQFERYRQFYIAPDIDLTKIKTKHKFLKTIFGAFGFIKFPSPALEITQTSKPKWHWIYF